MKLVLVLALLAFPACVQAAPRLAAFIVPDRSLAILLIGALFYFGFKWHTR